MRGVDFFCNKKSVNKLQLINTLVMERVDMENYLRNVVCQNSYTIYGNVYYLGPLKIENMVELRLRCNLVHHL